MRNPFKKGGRAPSGSDENLADRNGAFEYGKLAITSLTTTSAGALVAILAYVGQAKALPLGPADQLFLGLALVAGALACALACSLMSYINQALLAFDGERRIVWYVAMAFGVASLGLLVGGGVEAGFAVKTIVTTSSQAPTTPTVHSPSPPPAPPTKPACPDRDLICLGDQHEGSGAWFAGLAALAAGGAAYVIGVNAQRVSSKALKVASDEFVSSNRPRLRVRNIVWKTVGADVIRTRPSLVKPGETVSGQFYVSNIGNTEATLKDIYFMFFMARAPLPMERPYEGRDGNCGISEPIARPGEARTVVFDCVIETDILPDENVDLNSARDLIKLYAMGWIEYIDANAIIRRTTFCRHYDALSQRFMWPTEADPDYEFEE